MSLPYTPTPTHYTPQPSSPLAPSASNSSPIASAQARRRGLYKSITPSACKRIFSTPRLEPTDPQKAFLREKFRAKCAARADRDRKRSVGSKRAMWSDTSSDGFDVDMDAEVDEEEEERDFEEEFVKRVLSNEERKRKHAYRLSYDIDVGSSIDPNMYDIEAMERETLDEVPENDEPYDEEAEFELFVQEQLEAMNNAQAQTTQQTDMKMENDDDEDEQYWDDSIDMGISDIP
ncbi:hypothetical protein SISSUDRAFT_1064589 [Sistotremastrum suecicum HHB10207 ss-3]|uniref:Uncharacterized protein n=1 Tax=Sistotremastrum suecicum HHB10207 ss-3 TaxID=1314776 RepID=A0A166AGP5_9AGAM|nr:hypothetical protein SISSUDRAFT_1064589 [Sistotremastrum suecicum HHB10207 ss-3]